MDQLDQVRQLKRAKRTGWLTASPWESIHLQRRSTLPSPSLHPIEIQQVLTIPHQTPVEHTVDRKRKAGTPDGSARSGETTKESKANWLAHREPMGKHPPAASIHVASTLTSSTKST
ncbi:hypothetical protein SporoP8_12075 [Sporosarcina ureae]|nr:hypothetical protein SporoP8_12075 [Sporosarcina ureae]